MFFSHSFGEPEESHETPNDIISVTPPPPNTSPDHCHCCVLQQEKCLQGHWVGYIRQSLLISVHSFSYSLLALLRKRQFLSPIQFTVELYLFGLIGTASHPDMLKIWIIRFFFENMLHWYFEVRLLLFTVCTYM
jgi:hypothetical protein